MSSLCAEIAKRAKWPAALLALVYPAVHGWAAEMAVIGGANAGYSYDDNVQVAAVNKISLAGLKADGFVELKYDTARLNTATRLKLGADRYQYINFDSDDLQLKEPKASDFDSENYVFTTDISYDWERHRVSLFGQLASESTINTQFDNGLGGLGGLREIEGASQVDTNILRLSWMWQLTERQLVATNLQAQYADYQSDLYVNYDYYSVDSTWRYLLTESLDLQVRPLASRYENAASFSIASDTYGVETGVVWTVSEKWKLNALGGVTAISTKYDPDGYTIFNPVTGRFEFIALEEDTSNGFTGSAELTFTEERYGFSLGLDSGFSPSSNGYLQATNSAKFTIYWEAKERLRLDLDGRMGVEDTTGNQLNYQRTYSELAIRVGYQFAKNWWCSARYRYREQEQDNDRNTFGSASGNFVSANVSYRLPKDIL